MEFGIIKKAPVKKVSKEKYNFPVVTIKATPDTPKSKYFIQFNKAAATALSTIEGGMVGFGIEGKEVFISSITEGGYEVYKASQSITNKPLHLLLCEILSLDGTIDNELHLKSTGDSFEGKNVYQLLPLDVSTDNEVSIDVPEDIHYEAIADTIEQVLQEDLENLNNLF